MSYARKNPESDVYVYQGTGEGGAPVYLCHECCLSSGDTISAASPQTMLDHLAEHERVPAAAIERLKSELTELTQ